MSIGPGSARQEAPGPVLGLVSNRTDPFLWCKPEPLAGYPDLFLTPTAAMAYIKPTHVIELIHWLVLLAVVPIFFAQNGVGGLLLCGKHCMLNP